MFYITDENGNLIPIAGTGANPNLDCSRTEVVYSTSDASKLYGQADGIQGGETISGLSLSKYSALIIHSYNLNSALTLIYDMSILGVQSISGISNDNLAVMTVKCSVNADKTSFTVNDIGYWNTAGYQNRNGTSYYHVYKIEGILKNPAMIYTGKELFNEPVALNTTRTGQNDTVVEYYVSSDGNTWYRKWASGWKEFGKTILSNGYSMRVDFPSNITFSNANYTLELTALQPSAYSDGVVRSAYILERATTYFSFKENYASASSGGGASDYVVCYCCGF